MPSINGVSNNPKGKPKGTPDKKTKLAREAIALFVDDNADRLTGWLDDIAVDDPKAAFQAFMSVIEYHIPKLARVEQQTLDKNGEATDPATNIMLWLNQHETAGGLPNQVALTDNSNDGTMLPHETIQDIEYEDL